MAAASGKTPKSEKAKRQTPEERQAALRYNHMMYGPTAGELRPAAKKIDFGGSYLQHHKFQSLMTAFRNGTEYQFSVAHKDKSYTVSTDGTHILFDNKVIYYSRAMNKFERNLLMDRTVMLQYQAIDAFVHLAFAVIRSFPELGTTPLSYRNNEFFYGAEDLGAGIPEQGPNLLIGAYKLHVGKTK